jgi:Immunoglobulin domain/Bacterial Ig-like domain
MVSTTFAQPEVLITLTNTLWRYQAGLSAPGLDGTGWEEAAYNDSAWPEGLGLLAGGENNALIVPDINTVLPAPVGATYYYRTHFTWSRPTAGAVLVFTNRVDDGCVVYLNGVRIYDFNVSTEPALFGTPADGTIGGSGDATPDNAQVREVTEPASLIPGDNVIAVSVHQPNAGSSDSVWGCVLVGDSVQAPAFDPTLPADANVVQGRSYTLQVALTAGLPPPTLQWVHNGFDIPGETGTTYTIPDMSAADAGTYFVRAVNTAGTVNSRTATIGLITDNVPPQLVNATVQLDGTILLTFNEDLDPTAGFDTFNAGVVPAGGTISDDIGINSGTITGSNVVVVTPPLTPGVDYRIAFEDAVVYDAFGNPYDNGLPPGQFQFLPLSYQAVIIPIDDSFLWKWNQDGVELGSTTANPFFEPSFNDSSWGEGPALLGFDTTPQNIPEPIRTPLTSTASGGPNTTYFRTVFVLNGDPSSVQSLSMRTVVDDSCVIYLNGVEVLRVGIDPTVNPILFATQGRTVGDAVYEGPFDISTASLVAGQNVLACELKQHDSTSSDLIWGCELSAVFSSLSLSAPQILTQPSPATQTVDEGASVTYSVVASGSPAPDFQWQHNTGSGFVDVPGATTSTLILDPANPSDSGDYRVVVSNNQGSVISDTVTLNVTADLTAPTIVSLLGVLGQTNITIEFSEPVSQASATDLSHYSVQLRAGGGAVTILSATLSADGKTVTLTTDPRSTDNYSVTVMGIQDLSSAMNTIVTVTQDLPAQVVVTGFDYTALWKYNQEFFTDPPADWFMPNFDDSTWPEGPGILGEEVNLLPGGSTVLALGVPPIGTDLNNTSTEGGPNTIYFRKKFDIDVPLAEVQEFRLNYLYDDGFVAYLNGVEVIRHGVVVGQTYDTAATSHESDVIETSVLTGLMQTGNTLAVEMHQQSATGSSDIVWGSQLVAAVGAVTPQVRITQISIDGSGNVILEHNGSGVYVQETSDLAVPFVTRAGGPHASPYNAGPATGTRFFRLSDTP